MRIPFTVVRVLKDGHCISYQGSNGNIFVIIGVNVAYTQPPFTLHLAGASLEDWGNANVGVDVDF